ncbi:MAG: DUF4199 domain-containing protein [Acidobacteriota bacterium]
MLFNLITGAVVGLASASLIYILHFAEVLRTPLGGQLLLLAILFLTSGLLTALMRHRVREPEIAFGRLLGAGLAISMVAGLVLAIGSYVFTTTVDPTYLDFIRERSLEQLSQMDLPVEERAANEAQIAAINPSGYAMQGLFGTLVTGFLLSMTISAFLRMRVVRATQQ